jgi:cellulose synthase/poly-beta-1,6-N-acetylglucosamine synthase-like glycosyltransferase/beta-mannanase
MLNPNKHLKMNIFICVCGEPTDVIRGTIIAAKKAALSYKETINPYVAPKVVVLNDGKAANKDNWKEIKDLAAEYSVIHIARNVGGGFKAGNINNGLKFIPARDPFNTLDIILDADFVVKEHFLTEIAKPFRDESIDFVQSPQRYKNEMTWVAKSSAAHQIFFFEHICDSKGHDNALFLCGTNFAIRRSALNSIGGMNTRFITEDYATSLELHLRGSKGVFIPEVLAEGIAPTTLKQYFSQQQRWAKGSFDVSFQYLKRILFGPLTLRQKFHYMLSASYYLIGLRDLILMLAPLPYLFFGVALINANTLQYLAFVYGPLLVYNFILYAILFRHPVKSLVLDIASFPVFVGAFLSSVFKKELLFNVTIKKYEKENPFFVYRLQGFVAILLALGLIYAYQHPVNNAGTYLNFFWASFDVAILTLGFYLIVRENYNFSVIENAIYNTRYVLAQGINRSFGFSRLTRMLSIILLIGLIGNYVVNIPEFKIFADLETIKSQILPEPAKELLVPSKGIYYGYYQPALNAHPAVPKINMIANEQTSLVMYYQDWSPTNTFDTIFMKNLYKDNLVPVITWEPWESKKYTADSTYINDYSPESIINGSHDAYIRSFAKGAAAYRQPFYLRFAHEMNGNWYPWGSQNSPEIYIAMWRHVHRIFYEEHASNVIWVWSPNNTDNQGRADTMLQYYPGDEYVDWVGFSGFNWGQTNTRTQWSSFKSIVTDTYNQLYTINKPIMLAEISSVSTSGDKKAWFKDTLKSLPDFLKIKAVIFFNQDFNQADFSLNSGQDFNEIAKENIIKNPYYLKHPVFK